MDIKKYKDNLEKQSAALDDVIAKGVAAAPIPASKEGLNVGKSNFLTKSGWVYNIVGAIAFIAGLIIGSSAIWITGCASVTAGIYCIVKGRQQLRRDAFNAVGAALGETVDKTIATVSKNWTDFVVAQNVALRGDIVSSPLGTIDKVKALGWMTDSAWVHVNADEIRREIQTLEAAESLEAFKNYLPKVTAALKEDLHLACIAQTDVLNGIAMQKAPAAPEAAARPSAAQSPANTSAEASK